MKTVAKGFVEMAAYLSIAKFDDPDEAQGAEEIVGLLLIQASPEERALVAQIAREYAKEASFERAPEQLIAFYNELASNADHYQKYG